MKLISFLQDLNEATREFEKKILDPALMTPREYHDFLDPQNKTHPSSAYQVDVKKLSEYNKPNEFPELVNTKLVQGERLTMRMNVEDQWKLKYVKSGPDGWGLRDEQGNPIYMTPEEVKATGKPQFDYTYAIFNQNGECIAKAENEWGCWLFMVAKEYKGKGIGPWIGRVAREKIPDRTSGGFTIAGASNLNKIHDHLVRDYLQSGMYSWLVRSKQITMQQVKKILGAQNYIKTFDEQLRKAGYLDIGGEYEGSKLPDKKLALYRMGGKPVENVEESLTEAPLTGYEYHENPDDPSFGEPSTAKIAKSPGAKEKAYRAFKNLPWKFRVVFWNKQVPPEAVANPEVRTSKVLTYKQNHTWYGDLTDFAPSLGIRLVPDEITFMIASDFGDDFIPYTPWMIAHRFAHVAVGNKRGLPNFQDGFQRCFSTRKWMSVVAKGQEEAERFINSILLSMCTFKSAREDRVNNDGEVFMELFAQFMMQGAVKFNPCPPAVKQSGYGFRTFNAGKKPTGDAYVIDYDTREMINEFMTRCAAALNDRFTNLMNQAKGKIYAI